MRLYPRQGQTSIDHPEYGHFDANTDGSFDLPEDAAEQLRRFHVGGQPLWETDIERQNRLYHEELERRRDPATLMDAVQQLVNAAQAVPAPAAVPAPPAQATPKAEPVAKAEKPAEPAKTEKTQTPPPGKATRGRRAASGGG